MAPLITRADYAFYDYMRAAQRARGAARLYARSASKCYYEAARE